MTQEDKRGGMVWVDDLESFKKWQKGVTVIVLVRDKDGDPEPITMGNLHTETVLVNLIDGTIKVNTHYEPTLVDSDTGQVIERQS